MRPSQVACKCISHSWELYPEMGIYTHVFWRFLKNIASLPLSPYGKTQAPDEDLISEEKKNLFCNFKEWFLGKNSFN